MGSSRLSRLNFGNIWALSTDTRRSIREKTSLSEPNVKCHVTHSAVRTGPWMPRCETGLVDRSTPEHPLGRCRHRVVASLLALIEEGVSNCAAVWRREQPYRVKKVARMPRERQCDRSSLLMDMTQLDRGQHKLTRDVCTPKQGSRHDRTIGRPARSP